jgi:nonsense-mediated mRNA decay protein 3
VVYVDGKTVLVERSGTDLTGIDLESGSDVTIKKHRLDGAELLGRQDEARKTVLTMCGEDEAQLLDPDDFSPINIRKPAFLNAPDGSEINVIKTRKGVFILPKELC